MTWHRTIALLAAVLMIGSLSACAGGDGSDGTATETQAAGEETESEPAAAGEEPSGEPIRIGGTLGLTGSFAGPSEHYRILYEAAVEQVNEEGGLLGRPVELLLYDDESTQETAQSLYQRLINEDQVDLLLAPYTTFIGGSVLPVVRPSDKLMVNAGFTGLELARQFERLFMVWPFQEHNWTRPFFEMLEELPEGERPQQLAVLTAQNPFTISERDGIDGEGGVLTYAEEMGLDVVVNEEYSTDATDVSGLVQQAMDADADALVVLGLPNDSSLIARTVAELGYEPDVYCSCGSSVTTFPSWDDLSADAANGVFSVVPAWENESPEEYPGIDQVVQAFDEAGFDEMPAYGPVAYAAIQILRQAVEATGTTDNAELVEYLHDNEFQTATGPLSFNENGVPEFHGGLVQYEDGSNSLVWPSDRAETEPAVPRQ